MDDVRLTKRQRAQVGELLRCAWDRSEPIARIGQEQEIDPLVIRAAIRARSDVSTTNHDEEIGVFMDYYDQALEAAQRVEEGSWP